MTSVIGAVCAAMLAASCTPRVEPKLPAATPTAREIVDRMAATYAAATSYADRGTVRVVITGAVAITQTHTFETAFIRPDRFRFEFREEADAQRANLIWTVGTHTFSQWHARPGTFDVGTLHSGLAAATGVTHQAAWIVPSLLLPDQPGGWTSGGAVKLEGVEVIDGVSCWRISLGDDPREVSTLWIDQTAHLLRRIHDRHHFEAKGARPGFDSEQTKTYEPRLDQTADEEVTGPSLDGITVQEPEALPWMGIALEARTNRIKGVVTGGPADRAGLKIGDEVISINGESVLDYVDLLSLVIRAWHRKQPSLTIGVRRAGNELTLTLVLEPRPRTESEDGY